MHITKRNTMRAAAAVAALAALASCSDVTPTGPSDPISAAGPMRLPRLNPGGAVPTVIAGGTAPQAPSIWRDGVRIISTASAVATPGQQRYLLLENSTTGARAIWVIANNSIVNSANLGNVPTSWHIAGAGDFNSDGFEDILWENTGTGTGGDGTRAIWFLNGSGAVISSVSLGVVPVQWRIAGARDYDRDGHDDILFENTTDGSRVVWLMNGSRVSNAVLLGTLSTAWRMIAAPDLNSDGRPDILLENSTTGVKALWIMNASLRVENAVGLGTTPTSVKLVASTDVDSDGYTDIVFENSNDGTRAVWLEDGAARVVSAAVLTTVGTDWHIGAAVVPDRTGVYSIVELGSLGGTYSEPLGINASGIAVGLSQGSDSLDHATVWQPSGLTPLALGDLIAGGVSQASAINISGKIVGFGATKADLSTFGAAVWSASGGGPAPLATLGGETDAYATNTTGDIVGDAINVSGKRRPVIWPGGGAPRDLGTLSGAATGGAYGINDVGDIVGVSETASGARATIWPRGGSPVLLAPLAGYSEAYANAINNAGDVVGISYGATARATLWPKGGSPVDLGVLQGQTNSEAWGINDNQEIVGLSYASGPGFATLWTGPTRRIVALPQRAQRQDGYANSINASGQIVGTDTDASCPCTTHALVWRPSK